MEKKAASTCKVCGTPLVPSKKELKMDGSLQMDGSWSMGSMVCPKCHPELTKAE